MKLWFIDRRYRSTYLGDKAATAPHALRIRLRELFDADPEGSAYARDWLGQNAVTLHGLQADGSAPRATDEQIADFVARALGTYAIQEARP